MKKKITAIVDTGARPRRTPSPLNPSRREGGRRPAVLARGIEPTMAHTICGIDLGAFSVKFAFLEVGFRTDARCAACSRPRCPPATPRSSSGRCDGRARGALAGRGRGDALPGAAGRSALGARAASCRSPTRARSIRSSATSWRGRSSTRSRTSSSTTWSSAQRPEGSTVLAAAAKRDDDRGVHRGRREAQGIHPRALYAAPVVYRTLLPARRATAGRRARPPPPCQVVLDFGHARTNVCIVRDGRRISARTIRRGGVAPDQPRSPRRSTPTYERAEQAKRSEARSCQPGAAGDDAARRSSSTPCCARRWRRSCASCGRRWPASAPPPRSTTIDALLVTGGARAAGGPAAVPRGRAGRAGALPGGAPGARELTPAAEVADGDGRGRRRADESELARAGRGDRARREPRLARRSTSGAGRSSTAPASRSCARRRLHLAVLAVAMLLAVGLDVGAKRSQPGQRAQGAGQGAEDGDAGAVRPAARRRRGGHAAHEQGLPRGAGAAAQGDRVRSARSDLAQGAAAPTRSSSTSLELDIRPKKTFIKGTVDSAAAVDEIAAKLKEIDCFEDVTKGAITEVSGGAQAVHPHHQLEVPVSGKSS